MVNSFTQPRLFIDTSFITANSATDSSTPETVGSIENLSVAELVSIVLNKIIDGNKKNVPVNDVSASVVSYVLSDNDWNHSSSSSSVPMIINSQDTIRQDIFIKFQSSYEPEITTSSYLERIRKYSKCSDSCFILMLIYIDRLIEKKGLIITRLNIHRLLITAMMIAAKYHDDLFYNNAYFAKLGGLTLQELNTLELEVLTLLDYSMFIAVNTYEKYSHQLHNYKFMMHTPKAMKLTAPVVFGNEINWAQPSLRSEVPTPPVPATCVNAFQFSPHFLTPRPNSISPCGNSASIIGSRSSHSSHVLGASSLDSMCSSTKSSSTGFSFCRTGSLDSLALTSNPTAMDEGMNGFSYETKMTGVASNGYYYPPQVIGQQMQPIANPETFKKTLSASRGYFNHPYGSFVHTPSAPQPSFPFPTFHSGNFNSMNFPQPPPATYYPSVPQAPVLYPSSTSLDSANYVPNDCFAHPPFVHHSADRNYGLPVRNSVQPLHSGSKKRAHNDLYEGAAPNNCSYQNFPISHLTPSNNFHCNPTLATGIIGSQLYSIESHHHSVHVAHQPYYQTWNKAFTDFPEQIRLAALN